MLVFLRMTTFSYLLSFLFGKSDPYSERDAAKIIGKVLSAVEYMHNNKVMHRGKHMQYLFNLFS